MRSNALLLCVACHCAPETVVSPEPAAHPEQRAIEPTEPARGDRTANYTRSGECAPVVPPVHGEHPGCITFVNHEEETVRVEVVDDTNAALAWEFVGERQVPVTRQEFESGGGFFEIFSYGVDGEFLSVASGWTHEPPARRPAEYTVIDHDAGTEEQVRYGYGPYFFMARGKLAPGQWFARVEVRRVDGVERIQLFDANGELMGGF